MDQRVILVVDDEKNIRMTMSLALEVLGMPVHVAVNGEEALQMLREHRVALAFLDLRLPGMDGLDVLRRIRNDWPATRVIIISAHGTIASAVEAMKLGAVDFIQKPFSPAEIRELATTVLRREALDADTAQDHHSLVELAKRHLTDRNPSAARDAARKAIAADPSRPEAYNLLGALYEIAQQHEEAMKFYRAALDIDPTYAPAQANLERTTSWNVFGKIALGPEDAGKHHNGGAQ